MKTKKKERTERICFADDCGVVFLSNSPNARYCVRHQNIRRREYHKNLRHSERYKAAQALRAKNHRERRQRELAAATEPGGLPPLDPRRGRGVRTLCPKCGRNHMVELERLLALERAGKLQTVALSEASRLADMLMAGIRAREGRDSGAPLFEELPLDF